MFKLTVKKTFCNFTQAVVFMAAVIIMPVRPGGSG